MISFLCIGSAAKCQLKDYFPFVKNDKIYAYRYVQHPPIFPFGIDSCKRFYFTHFNGYDSLIAQMVSRGDTSKYIRIYFSFVVDQFGMLSNVRFTRIATTRYAKSMGAKTVRVGNAETQLFDQQINQMLFTMSAWHPALQDGLPVNCWVEDFLQVWVGANPPAIQ